MSFRSLLRDTAMEMVESGRPLIANDVVKEVQVRYPEEYAAEVDRLAFNACNREAKKLLKDLSEDDGKAQLTLPGLDLPSVIAIPCEGGDFVYRATYACTLDEVEAGRIVRASNVLAAQAKLDSYDENLRRLRPVMESHPGITVGDAAKIIAGEAS
ncbi:MAG: hypothetical protein EBR82_87950 [Caulobacteraceae bacterium]|nr:hypothetical protein [Caulobacteraceae bacterium]